MEDIFLRQCRKSRYRDQAKCNGGGGRVSNPFIAFYEGRTYRQPEVVLLMPQEALFARGAHSMQVAMRSALLRRGHFYKCSILLLKFAFAGN